MPEEKTDKKKVFISYGHDNCKDLAFLLCKKLKEQDYEPWVDTSELRSGEDWEFDIENGVKESDSFLALMTPYSMRRPDGFCLNELTLANILHKPIIPIMVRKVIPPLSIVRLQYFDFQVWECSDDIFNSKFQKILDVVDRTELGFEGEYSFLLDKLSPIDFGAEIDKHIRNFYGRDWIIQEVENWLHAKTSKIFLLKGDPGIGKTAIASKICREFAEVSAYHLIEHSNPIKADAKECVLSLAYQLSNQIPELASVLRADGLKFLDKENAISLFDRLIVQPFRNISEPKKPKLIVIDALDEAKREKKSGKGMENEMLDFIAELFELTPKWLKLFITSRPEQYILNKLEEFDPFTLDTRDERNNEDIRGYLKRELKRIFPNTPTENAINTIVERSEGIFLYIVKILEDMERDPKQGRLKIENPEMFPKGLTKWYLQNFGRQFPDEEYYDKNLIPFLELIVAAQEPLKLSLIQDILGWDRYHLNKAVQALGTLFKITPDKEIEPFHKTLIEWLIDEKATQAADRTFYIHEINGDNKLANFGWDIYKLDPSQLPFYFFHHLAYHLSEAKKIDKLNNLKTEMNIKIETTDILDISSMFTANLTQKLREEKRYDILAEYLLDSKKVSCPACKNLNIKYSKQSNLYQCLNFSCKQEPFDTKIHSKFKKVFFSFSPDEKYVDLIEIVRKDLVDDTTHSIQETIQEAQILILFLSLSTLQNEKCLLDLDYARETNKQIITILLEDFIPPVGSIPRQVTPLDFKNSPFTDLEYKAKLNQLKYKIEEELIIYEAKTLSKIYLSYETGSKFKTSKNRIIQELDTAFRKAGIGSYISDIWASHEICINNLKNCDFAFCLIFPSYGSLMNDCTLKEDCKAECPMKTGEGRISYNHCEYKTIRAEGILHFTYVIDEGWDKYPTEVSKEASEFKEEFNQEMYRLVNIDDPNLIKLITNNLADLIIRWYSMGKMEIPNFSGRKEALMDLMENIDDKIEILGVGGIGKTTLIQVALLLQKLKGREILAVETAKFNYTGIGYEPFREYCRDCLFETEQSSVITIYDIYNALGHLIPEIDGLIKKPKNELIRILSEFINKREDLILFIDDFHLATDDVVDMVESVDRIIIASRKRSYLVRKEIYLTGLDEEDREELIKIFSPEIPDNIVKIISKIAEGHPVSTKLLVKNYQKINFDKLKDFNLVDAGDNQIKDFYCRLLEEILSTNELSFILLKDLAILNPDLQTNINKESIFNSYDIELGRKAFKHLVDTDMLKKKEGKTEIYEFTHEHIQSALKSTVNQESHQKAIKYYQNKIEILGDNPDDSKEIEYHRSKLNSEDN